MKPSFLLSLGATHLVSAAFATNGADASKSVGVRAELPVHQLGDGLASCKELKQRKSWTSLTNDEKRSYIDAELCLMNHPSVLKVEGSQNLWDDLMYTHIAQANVIHNNGPFRPWHRLYMRVHEFYLQAYCGYDGGQPYWDELADAEANHTLAESSVFDPTTGFGSGDIDADTGCVINGPFVNLTMHLNQTSNDANFCLSRDLNPEQFQLSNSSYVDECFALTTYADVWNCWGTSPHLAGHFGVGGTMLDVVSSPGDPLFYLHHTNLDRLWWEWQSMNSSTRLDDITGPRVASDDFLEQSNLAYPGPELLWYDGEYRNATNTTLKHNLWSSGLVANVTIRDVMDLRGPVICAEYV